MDKETKNTNRNVFHLGKDHSIANVYMSELRDEEIQQNRARFRQNIYRLGQIAGYELSRQLNYESYQLQTPLAEATGYRLVDQPVIATILRAGLPLSEGFFSFFDKADAAFVSAYRKHDKYDGFAIELTSISCPDVTDRTLILCDSMLATGQSLVKAIESILELGEPFQVIICTVIASEEGIAYVSEHYPTFPIYTFAIDPELNAKSYIVPGLGDAGDLSFGPKIQE